MNDENLTSDELFRSGSTIINTDNCSQSSDISGIVEEPRLCVLDERIQQTNETHVKEIDDIESLIDDLNSLTLSTDGGNYADIHHEIELHAPIERNGNNIHRDTLGDKTNDIHLELVAPDLPVIETVPLNEQFKSRGSQYCPDHTIGGIHEEKGTRQSYKSHSKLKPVEEGPLSERQKANIRAPNLQHPNMADSQEPQHAVSENETGARAKVRNMENRKTKKESKGTKSRTSDTCLSDMPSPPFRLQQKKYDMELDNHAEAMPAVNEHTKTENWQNGEIEPFPVEYLNPYVNPMTQRTIRPGTRANPEFLQDSFQFTSRNTGTRPTAPLVVRPKTYDGLSKGPVIRHNNSDSQLSNLESLSVERGSIETSLSEENVNSDNTPVLRLRNVSDFESDLSAFNRPIVKSNASVRPKDYSPVDRPVKISNERKGTTNIREKEEFRRTADINKDSWSLPQEIPTSTPPHTIEYINNLDTITTKKVQNKDMKNTNRGRNMVRNSGAPASSADSQHETVLTHTPMQSSLEQPVIDLQTVSRHVVPDTNESLSSERNRTNSDTHPVIVPYEHVQMFQNCDESLSTNVLFGDGIEMSDEELARMLQEKFDKEDEEMMQRNHYDIAPETLRLHNLTIDSNVADGSFQDGYTFSNDLETDSLLINRNLNDVYETSPRSVESDQGPEEQSNIIHNRFDVENNRLYPHSIVSDSIVEPEQYFPSPELSHAINENNETYEIKNAEQAKAENVHDAVYVRYNTEQNREVLPETLDDRTIYVRAEQEGAGADRGDESFARSLLRREQEHLDEELARQLEEEEREESERESYRHQGFRNRRRYSDSQHPLHYRYSAFNSRLPQDREADYHGNSRQIENTWDRPLRQPNIYGHRHPRRQNRDGYDIYEYEPDFMPDQYGDDDFVSISRDPRLLATVLMGRAPNMMVPDNVDLNDYEALWDLAEELGEVRRVGMDQQEISLLPLHMYKAPEDGDKESADCRVCLVDFSNGDRLRTLPCCHIYHVECIDEWLKRNAVCPVCRQSARQ